MANLISLSLETHLFFARIMKEHALFLEAGMPCCETARIHKAKEFREQFEALLSKTVRIACGKTGAAILQSGELTTEFTIRAEERTAALSGIPIDTRLTVQEKELRPGCCLENNRELFLLVRQLNLKAICLLNGFIEFKETLLSDMKSAKLFTFNYPLLISHILREARQYRSCIDSLTRGKSPYFRGLFSTEEFWNQIMMEHALFIRGLLDPSEEKLICTADSFAKAYRELLNTSEEQGCRCTDTLTRDSLTETKKYRDFKAAGTKGILNCSISSVILPLLADHILREANHYIRLLSFQ